MKRNFENLVEEIQEGTLDAIKEAVEKHGWQIEKTIPEQFMITTEEFGEIAKDLNDMDYDKALKEILQTLAMLYKLYSYIKRERDNDV